MRVLVCLAEHAGEVVSSDELLKEAWSGVIVSQDSVYQAVASLRRLLGDDPRQPTYIETVPRLGYRLVATVSPWIDSPVSDATPPSARQKPGFAWVAAAAAALAIAGVFLFAITIRNRQPATAVAQPQPLKSLAVLPFRDLTEDMNQEPFADGMTVELIDKLSKVPGLRVHAPMASSSAKGKRSGIAGMAKMLGVAYVIDGSVRKSGSHLRVVARLIHADDEYVVWSETYDRAFDDILKVQDEIAGEVTRALRGSI